MQRLLGRKTKPYNLTDYEHIKESAAWVEHGPRHNIPYVREELDRIQREMCQMIDAQYFPNGFKQTFTNTFVRF